MPSLKLYHVDAFADRLFRGNPAAVCPLASWLPDQVMQSIAAENNLSETAFYVPSNEGYDLRWFTPRCEVPLCGHATLATAFVIFRQVRDGLESLRFHTASGPLVVSRAEDLLVLDLPSLEALPVPSPPSELVQGLGGTPDVYFKTEADPNYYAVFRTEAEVRNLRPDFAMLAALHPYGVVATGPGRETDIVSRCFAPSYGIPEDPVTGSIHCALTPYWARRLGRDRLSAYQASERGGRLRCELRPPRVHLIGSAVLYLEGTIQYELGAS